MTGHLTPSTVYAPSPTTHRGEATSMSILPKGDKLVYPSGKLVVIRSTTDAHRAWLYTQHSCNVRVPPRACRSRPQPCARRVSVAGLC